MGLGLGFSCVTGNQALKRLRLIYIIGRRLIYIIGQRLIYLYNWPDMIYIIDLYNWSEIDLYNWSEIDLYNWLEIDFYNWSEIDLYRFI